MTVTISTVAASVAASIIDFRKAAVTSENKATPMARSIIASIMSGSQTASSIVPLVIRAFGDPKSPKTGKAIETLSGLRAIVGGDATRKTVETVLNIAALIDYDAETFVKDANGDDTDSVVGASAIRPLITSFVLSDPTAPKSLAALDVAVKALVKAHVKAVHPAETASEDNGSETSKTDETPNATPAPVSLGERINVLSVALAAASDEDFVAVNAEFMALIDAFNARVIAMNGDDMAEGDDVPVAVNG